MDYRVEVKSWMTKKSSGDFDFMAKWNNDIPMPLVIMYGVKIDETRGMVKMSLHGDIKERITQTCMCCGRPITNEISKYFGMGPKCGNHNYTNPFDSAEELQQAVDSYRTKLVNMTWEGWIAKSAIISINNDTDVVSQIASMETVAAINPTNDKSSPSNPSKPTFVIRIATPTRCTEDYSAYVSFKYNAEMLALVKSLPSRFYNADTKEWEIPYTAIETLKSSSDKYDFSITGAEMVKVQEAKLPDGFTFKTHPYSYQEDGVLYGMGKSRWLLGDHQGLGKTKQIIDLACARKISDGLKHCLIVCGVNSLKWNWMEEVVKHSNEQGRLLGQKITRKGKIKVGSNADKLVDAKNLANIDEYFIITNVESLRDTKIADALNEACEDGTLGMVAIDEAHRCFSYDTLINTDVGDLKIGDIVTNRLPVKVLSYNEQLRIFEWKPVVGWFENPVFQRLMELEIEIGGQIRHIRCTDTHKFFTENRGWVQAKDLSSSDTLISC